MDGIFGPSTDAAVRAFQQQKGLAVNGIVGATHLVGADRHGPAAADQGDAVRGVQEEFAVPQPGRASPGQGPQVDGIFGPKTAAAGPRFPAGPPHRTSQSVTVDGIVGPVTWRALVSGMLSL